MTELSLIIPAYNAAPFLEQALAEIGAWLALHPSAELIFVDDGSSDHTAQIAECFARTRDQITVIRLPRNCGKGAALRAGIALARGRYHGFTDIDLPYGLSVIDAMHEAFQKDATLAFLYGSRTHVLSREKKGYGLVRTYYAQIGRQGVFLLLHFFGIGDVHDTLCGVKMITKDLSALIVQKAFINRFAADIEWFIIARANRYRYRDFPVELNHRNESSLHLVRDTALIFKDMVRMAFQYLCGHYYAH